MEYPHEGNVLPIVFKTYGYKKRKVLHLILFINNCRFSKQMKTIMKARWQWEPHLKQVDDEVC
jgi:hypothetical protein